MAAKTRKAKVGPMSVARKAIFVRFDCDEAKAAELHGQLTTQYDQLLKLNADSLTFTDDREANGNMILVAHFERLRASEERQAGRIQAANRQAVPFQRIFRVPLRKYFHPVFGFNVAQFDLEVVKSPDGESCKEAVRRQWGEEGLAIVMDLMGTAKS